MLFADVPFGKITLKARDIFMEKEDLKDVVRDLCIQQGFYILVVRSDAKRYTVFCATAGCRWILHACLLADGITWAIKSIIVPNHRSNGFKPYNKMANADWAAKKMIGDIRRKPDLLRGKHLNDKINERFRVKLKKFALYKTIELVLSKINGTHDESYAQIAKYAEVIKVTNPESCAICLTTVVAAPEQSLQLKSLFLSFKAQFCGLMDGCRHFIGVSLTVLKGKYGGVLLSAAALDGNNELFPIAVAFVESPDIEG